MWVQTKTDAMTLVNLDHATLIQRSTSHGKPAVIAMIEGKGVLLAVCDTPEDAAAILAHIAAVLHTNPPALDLRDA